MKFDMHCHTKEGSLDGRVSVEEYIEGLKSKGFDGMLICDHNTYKGYRAYEKKNREKNKYENRDFIVLRGLEYDTLDAGHILVIMPREEHLKLLEIRGLPVVALIELVHKNGGILGPAHPFGEKYVSLFKTKKYCNKSNIMEQFDFLEGFNSCESKERNELAQKMAEKYQKPVLGGSDAHKRECVGLGYTWLPQKIKTEDDLIACIKEEGDGILCGGSVFDRTAREKLGIVKIVWVAGFRVYSFFAYFARYCARHREIKKWQR